MIRGMFTIASVLSLSLCAATIVLWVRSGRVKDVLMWRFGKHDACWTESVRSGVQFVLMNNVPDNYQTGWVVTEPSDPVMAHTHLGFGAVDAKVPSYDMNTGKAAIIRVRAVDVPYLAAVIMTALLPALWVFRRSRSKRRPGFCASCGYDLRGSSERCPECGTPIPATP